MFTVNTIKITYMIFIRGFWTTKNNKDCKDNVCCKDIVVKVIVAKRCCCEKMVNVNGKNVDVKGWLMLLQEMLPNYNIATKMLQYIFCSRWLPP